MTFQSALPVPETEIGLAIEATRGTAVYPTVWVPVMGPKYKPDLTLLPDETLQGSMVKIYDEIAGLRYDSHGWDSYPYLDSFPVLVRALLGSSDNVTAKSSNTTLAAPAVAGATSLTTTASVTTGTYVVLDAGTSVQETVLLTGTGTSPTLQYPTKYAHANLATVTGLTSHAFSLLNNSPSTGNQPPSLTVTDYAGDVWRQLTAAQLDNININGGADVLPKYTTALFANAAVTPTTPVPSFSAVEAPPGWTVDVAIGGTQIGYLVTWEFDLKRSVKPVPAITGTQAYYQYLANAIEATLKLTVLASPTEPELATYEAGTVTSLDLTLTDTSSGFAINFHSTKAKFLTGAIDRSKEWAEVPLDVQLLPSTTDALAGGVSPIKITVANAQTGSY
jgi:hypothetical protein